MEKLVLNLSLTDIMIRKVIIHLWNLDESFSLFLWEKFRLTGGQSSSAWLIDSQKIVKDREEWQEALEKVKAKVTALGVPASLEKKMTLVAKPIGLEMLRGKLSLIAENFSDSPRDVGMQILKQLSWTYAGEVDYRKTVENLVHLETLNVVKRFRLARLNYLVDHIPGLWTALPKKYRKWFDHPNNHSNANMTYWYHIIKGTQSVLHPSTHLVFFRLTTIQANIAGTKYFFQKLSKEERDLYLCSYVCELVKKRFMNSSFFFDVFSERFSGVLFYLLSEMSREQVEQVLKERPCHLLGCFLDWPFQDLLPDIADVVWPYIPESKYEELWNIMQESFSSSGYYFPDVFQKFFLRSPATFRSFFLERDDTFLPEFINSKDADTIVAILGSLDAAERVELISHKPCFFDIFNKLVMNNDCDFVKLCLRVALKSVEDREKVRKTFMDHATALGEGSVKCKVRKWKKVFDSLKDDDWSCVNKRSLRSRASTRVKKPRTH